ncbi:ABC transporter permease [Weissella ceti]|uniref:ABC transporter permease n=1 Tax=Weissella ceti TaxID=759620 RepID=UPI0009DFE997|nr:ABC transporter permease [Weissella ceti]
MYTRNHANRVVSHRLARFNVDNKWANSYLGDFWDYLEPMLFIATYFLVFGLGFYQGSVSGQPYLLWLITAIIPWFYIQGVFNRGLTSVKDQVKTLSKTRFPFSIAVIIPMIEEFRRYVVMTIGFVGILLIYGYHPSIYWLQFLYAVFAMVMMLIAMNLINSTLTILIPDYKAAMSALFRLIFYSSGVIVNLNSDSMPYIVTAVLKLSPFNYVVNTFRDTFLYHQWFWETPGYTLFFWGLVALMMFVGAFMHIRFRGSFTELV